MSRVRQFGQLRDSRSSSMATITATQLQRVNSSHNYLCVECVNHSLSKQKERKSHAEKNASSMLRNQQSQIQKGGEERERLLRAKKQESEKKQCLQVSLSLSRIQINRREEIQTRKCLERKQQDKIAQYQQKQIAAEAHREKLLKQNWLRNIKGQVAVKEQQKQEQKQSKLAEHSDKDIFHSQTPNHQTEQTTQYRTLLKQQRLSEQARKVQLKEEAKQEIDIKYMPILDQAEKREQYHKQVEEQRKRVFMEEARKMMEHLKTTKEQKQTNNRRQREEAQVRERKDYKEVQDKVRKKEKAINAYLHDLKGQIKVNSQQREQNRETKLKQHEEAICPQNNRKTYPLKNCDSCQKSTQKVYLTRFEVPN